VAFDQQRILNTTVEDAETNLKRGNCVVLLRGVLRGVERDDIAPRT